ncbi:MAG: glutamate racemase [Culicoidibacterales bacterium]
MKKPIGIIDSGIGGMSVVKALLDEQPELGFVYLGDQARCPYGERTTAELLQFTTEMIEYLMTHYQVSAVVIACNTISANCLPEIRARFALPIISIVECGIMVAKQHQLQPLGVIATPKTIASKMYQVELADYQIQALAAPPFAVYVETQAYTQADIEAVLAPLKTKALQGLILGCTHYPFLAAEIQKILPECQLLDPATEVLQQVADFIYPTKRQIILTTGATQQFEQLLAKLLPEYQFDVSQINLRNAK